NYQAQIGLHHFLLRLECFALSLLHHLRDPAELAYLESGLAREHLDVVAMLPELFLVSGDEVPPAPCGKLGYPVEPVRMELGAPIALKEVLARDAVTLGQPHQFALVTDQPFIDVMDLLDQRIDARLFQSERLHLGDYVVLEFLVAAFLRRREALIVELELDILILKAAQPLVGVRNVVEGLQHFGLELSLHGRERQRDFHIVIEFAFIPGGVAELALFHAMDGRGRRLYRIAARGCRRRDMGLSRDRCSWHHWWCRYQLAVRPDHVSRYRFGIRTCMSGFKIDDLAQEDLSFVELVAPDGDGLESEGALAQACDHGLATPLDALGNGDFTFAREQLHASHLTQIHAHGIIGAPDRLFGLGFGRDCAPNLDQLP